MTIAATKAGDLLPKGLPAALRPWAPAFQDMPEAHLRLIGDLMAQLDPLLEETFEIDAQSYGDFNGYDGMALRGEIERLLPSEWLWRDLAPDEFLRRFAEQELMFHRPAFESPVDERTHVVIIDCGPCMLGRPRLVALAALLCLSAIAGSHGAKLVWIAPQADVKLWRPMLTQEDLKTFLLSANPLALRPDQLEELVEALPGALPDGAAGAELLLWTIGAAPLAPASGSIKTNQIVITEKIVLSPDGMPVAEARVDLTAYAGRRKEAVLTFPSEEDCVSLLREPYRPPRPHSVRAAAKPRTESEAAPFWAPQEVVFQQDPNAIVARIPRGLLRLSVSPQGQIGDAMLVPLESFDNILGMRWAGDHVHLALTRKYNGFSILKIRRLRFPAQTKPHQEMPEFRLDENDPAALNKHPKSALPPLIKPSHRFRFHALTGKGDYCVIRRDGAALHLHTPRLPLIGYRYGWAFMLGRCGGRFLVARNLASSQCMTFALPENATVEGLDDIVCWPERMGQRHGCVLLARCDDGHWRGQAGKPNLRLREEFSPGFADHDLSGLGDAIPLGAARNEAGELLAWQYHFWSPVDRSVHRCNFGGSRVETERVNAIGLSAADRDANQPGRPRLRAALYRGFLFSWEVDAKGYVTSLRGGYRLDGKIGQPLRLQIPDLLQMAEEATCLSD